MKQYIATLSLVIIMTGTLGGCSQPQPSSNSQKNSPTNAVTATKNTKDLCLLVNTGDISTILGYAVEADKGNMPQTDTATSCRYKNNETGYGVSIIANYDNKYGTASSQYKDTEDFQLEDAGTNPPHSELNNVVGDKSFGWSTGSITQFNALKGNVWITLSLFGGDETTRINQAKTIGEKVLNVL